MVARNRRYTAEQLGSYTGALTKASPTGGTLYVDSNKGSDGNSGLDPRFPLLTLTRAAALAEAGDTVYCVPGGSETVTASIALTVARLRVVCPIADFSDSGFNIVSTGALTDQMTIAGTDNHIEGLKFTRSAGAGAANAAINAAATADRLEVENCLFSGSLLTSSWANFGIELTDALQHFRISKCQFRDMHRGIINVIATAIVQVGGKIEDCEFWVGRATAYGYYNDPTSTGVSGGITLSRCEFKEIIASTGAAATDVWNGVAATDGDSGPMNIGALCDRLTVEDCVAYSASGETFQNLCKVDAGGLVEFARCSTSAGTGAGGAAIIADSIAFSVAVVERGEHETADSTAASVQVVAETANSTAFSVQVVAETAASTAASTQVVAETAASTAASIQVVAETAQATAEVANSTAFSVQVVDGQADADADSTAFSIQVVAETAASTAASIQVVAETAASTAASVQVVAETAASTAASIQVVAETAQATAETANSTAFSVQVVANIADSTAASVQVVAETAASTAAVADSTAHAAAVVASTAKGQPFCFTKTITDTDIPNNTQTYAMLTATGGIMIEEIIFQRSAANMTGPTTVEFGTSNIHGPTGATVIASNILAGFNANLKLLWTTLGAVAGTAFALESTKVVWCWGDDNTGAGGTMEVTVKGYRLTDGASLA